MSDAKQPRRLTRALGAIEVILRVPHVADLWRAFKRLPDYRAILKLFEAIEKQHADAQNGDETPMTSERLAQSISALDLCDVLIEACALRPTLKRGKPEVEVPDGVVYLEDVDAEARMALGVELLTIAGMKEAAESVDPLSATVPGSGSSR